MRHETKITTRRRHFIGVPAARINIDGTWKGQDIQHFSRTLPMITSQPMRRAIIKAEGGIRQRIRIISPAVLPDKVRKAGLIMLMRCLIPSWAFIRSNAAI